MQNNQMFVTLISPMILGRLGAKNLSGVRQVRITTVLVASLILALVAGHADSQASGYSLDLGTFSSTDGEYFAWTATLAQEPWCAYVEVDTQSDYDLFIGTWKLDARGDRAVLRLDDNRVRVGAFAPLIAGFSARLIAGEGPTRLDVWTPSARLVSSSEAGLSVLGWVRAHEDNSPDWWVCPTLNWGDLSVQYEYNLRRDGSDFICTNYRLNF